MDGGLAPFLGRVVFLSAVPLVTWLTGSGLDGFVATLSALACVLEVVFYTNQGRGGKRKSKHSLRPARFFPLQVCLLYCIQLWLFMLRHSMGAQVEDSTAKAQAGRESIAANAQMGRAVPDHPAASSFSVAQPAVSVHTDLAAAASNAGGHVAMAAAAPVAAAPPVRKAADYVSAGAASPVSASAAEYNPADHVKNIDDVVLADTDDSAAVSSAGSSVADSAGVSSAGYGAKAPTLEGFVLDAAPETLRWIPKTISVVLPCAEERDYAFKTVKSFVENTPTDVLHEIVVVDDGSNPPLSQTHLMPEVQRQYKVKIVRHDDTIGLIGSKKSGGDAASGDIVAFFDCHVAPQPGWEMDFLRLIGENYRRMVIPKITNLDIETWTQTADSGGAMSKCYVTWDGDFKWGGPDDMYMGMLSGGLAGMSKRWWNESGGFDDQMLGWGGENIDQGVRMWVCGGEIVAAPNSQVAHMWRTGDKKTAVRYKHVGDTMHNRARAIHAWFGDFSVKLDDFPTFKERKDHEGEDWYGDMSNFQKVKDRLGGCRPFAWYLRRFKFIYEDGGLLPPELFMLREETSGKCIRFKGHAGTSGAGREAIQLQTCDPDDDRFFWHKGNVDRRTGKCCSGLRAWNTDQCLVGKVGTGICEVTGRDDRQRWTFTTDGYIRTGDRCLGPGPTPGSLKEGPCISFRSSGGALFTKQGSKVAIETKLYNQALLEHPEVFVRLNKELAAQDSQSKLGPETCKNNPGTCLVFTFADGSGRCFDDEAHLTGEPNLCSALRVVGKTVQRAESGQCLDTSNDDNAETWLFYACHGESTQQFAVEGGKMCSVGLPKACFETKTFGR